MKQLLNIILLLVMLSMNYTAYSQQANSQKKASTTTQSPNSAQIAAALKKINSLVQEYLFSKGVSQFDKFKINGYYVTQGEYKIDLRKVDIHESKMGLVFDCYDNIECIKETSSETKAITNTPFVAYPISDTLLIGKLITEFTRIKNLLNI